MPRRPHLRVLITDPVENAADSLGLMLNLWGYDVQVAYTGLEALKIIAYHQPHVVLMPLALPDVDAALMAAQLRDDTTLVALIDDGDDDDVQQCKESGFRYLFIKSGTAVALHLLLDGLEQTMPLGRAG